MCVALVELMYGMMADAVPSMNGRPGGDFCHVFVSMLQTAYPVEISGAPAADAEMSCVKLPEMCTCG